MTPVQGDNMGANKKRIISQKVQKAQALQHDVDQAGKTVPRKEQVKDLSLHFCFFRIAVFLCLLLFCLHIFLIRKKKEEVRGMSINPNRKIQNVIKGVYKASQVTNPPPPPRQHASLAVRQFPQQGAPPLQCLWRQECHLRKCSFSSVRTDLE